MKKIAVIGTGIMGSGMALNFRKHGYSVFVWNRSAARLKPLQKKGAIAVRTPKEAAKRADIVFEVTADDASSRQVWMGKDSILSGARKGTTLITSGTFSIKWIDELARECKRRKLTYFDMPLTGSRAGAEKGELVILVGGDAKKLKRLLPDLRAISKEVLYFGKAGAGARFKLLLNTLFTIHLVGFAEALRIAKRAGLDLEKVGNALAERPGGSTSKLAWQVYHHPPRPINFSLKWMTKDLRYARKLGASLDLPLLDQVLRKLSRGVRRGLGARDWTSVMKLD